MLRASVIITVPLSSLQVPLGWGSRRSGVPKKGPAPIQLTAAAAVEMDPRTKWCLFWFLYAFCAAAAACLLTPGVLFYTGADVTTGFQNGTCQGLVESEKVVEYEFSCGKYCTKRELCCDLPVSVSPAGGGAPFPAVLARRACVNVDSVPPSPCEVLDTAIIDADPARNISAFACSYRPDRLGQVPGATFCPSAFRGDGGSCDIVATYLEWPYLVAKQRDIEAMRPAAIAMLVLGTLFGVAFLALTVFWIARVARFGCRSVTTGERKGPRYDLEPSPANGEIVPPHTGPSKAIVMPYEQASGQYASNNYVVVPPSVPVR
ncbi:hypothetical protein DFJ74DRAFT_123854 [Hyaloraphidium curvatum]|nr:hypothetical protein DFJ74DRAFT_123854 [Hyaloraphidium curvatum]